MKNVKITSYSVVLVLALVVLSITIPFFVTYNVTEPQLAYAQIKGGLSASSVNPNSTIEERSGNTTADLLTGGTSPSSVTEGLTMTMSESGRTGNTTNLTSSGGGLSASSVQK
jgi:hypothetical protein